MQWCIALLVFGAALLLAYYSPDERRARRYKAELAARAAVSDEELSQRFFAASDVAAAIPVQVRRLFAKHMGYPAEKMLPDDDLLFFWREVDMAGLIHEIETTFAIEISDKDAEQTPCSIREVTLLVAGKINQAVQR